MSSIRKIACYLTLMLLLNCVIQGEMIWLSELLEGRMFPEQNMRGDFEIYRDTLELVWSELVWFPVPVSAGNADAEVAFENSWMAERNYGGKRSHEGTDLMASLDQSGYYPVVSITDGVIEQIGWLEKGGWRIGVRSLHDVYFYYAHLDSYAEEFKPGDVIRAGQLLGYMGNTGYGKTEGTSGKFDVHLHLGIYLRTEEIPELAVNPYWFLKYLENNRLRYAY